MRILATEPVLVDVPLATPVRGVHGTTALQRSLLVRVTTDAGVEGWGNVDPSPGYSLVSAVDVHDVVARLAPALVGADPFNLHRALALMDGEVADGFEAKAAIEMALLDVKGRALDVPVHSLLGGALTREVTLNAWIGTVPPAQAATEAGEWLRRGFTTAKIKISGAGDEGIARVAAVRAAVGDRLALRVDFNESLSRVEAVPLIRRLEPYALTLVEQPVARTDLGGLAEIRRAIGIPLMADESVTGPTSLIDIIRLEAADIVKVKVMKQGGLTRTRQMIECAAAAGLRVVVGHGFGLTLSTLAEAAVAATSAAVLPGCEAVGPLKMAGDSPVLGGALRQMDEWLTNLKQDRSHAPDHVKIRRAKPSDLVDACFTQLGTEKIAEPATFQGGGVCNGLFPAYSSPRMVAGEPVANNVLKCQLKPIDHADYTVTFSSAEKAQLAAVFPQGVCDYRKPGVGQKPFEDTWEFF